MSKQKIYILFFGTVSRILIAFLGRFSAVSKRNILWRIACFANLREIRYRNANLRHSANPFILFERYFAHDFFYLERFQNLVAGHRVLVNLLDIEWFLELPVAQRVPITALFRRVAQAENVYYTYRNRQDLIDSLQSIENTDQDSLPPEIFLPPNRDSQVTELESAKSTSDFSSALLMVLTIPAAILSGLGFVLLAVFLLIFTILVLPFKGLRALGVRPGFLSSIRALLQRMELSLYQRSGENTDHIAHILSRYETDFGQNPAALHALAKQFSKPEYKDLLTPEFVDSIPLKDRVVNIALFRRMKDFDDNSVIIGRLTGLEPSFAVQNQRDVAQLTRPPAGKLKDLKLFRSLSDQPISQPKPASKIAKPDVAQASSEILLGRAGWFATRAGPEFDFCEAIRRRSYVDLLNIGNDREKFSALSSRSKKALGSMLVLVDEPLPETMTSIHTFDKFLTVPLQGAENATRRARAKITAWKILESLEGDAAQHPLRSPWVRLQKGVDNDAAFPALLERLLQIYKPIPVTRITLRSLSFDTFLVTELENILIKAEQWIDWDELTPPMSALLANAASLVGNSSIFKKAFYALSQTPVSKAYLSNVQNGFFANGFHKFSSLTFDFNDFEDTIQELDPEKKYLCLVEAAGKIRPLRQLHGADENLVCAPVVPADAVRYPKGAALKQIEDFIPMFCKEDMDIAHEVDAIVTDYLDIARDQIREAGFDDAFVNAVEITHATVYFSGYRDALGAKVSEKLIKSANEYDGVLLILRNGHTLGELAKTAAKIVGDENVFVALETDRVGDIKGIVSQFTDADDPLARPVKAKTEDVGTPEWVEKLSLWLAQTGNIHKDSLSHKRDLPYALLGLEHINGYFDSYVALAEQSLKHFNVEMFVSRANKQLNKYIAQGNFRPFEKKHRFSQSSLKGRYPPPREWTESLVSEMQAKAKNIKSPWLSKYPDLFIQRFNTVFGQRLPQIMDAVCYFEKRFDIRAPEYVFTGPNQHMISRAASYAALKRDIPVYDFLILANTNHPRYRPPVASHVYLYDPWYEEIYKDFMGMKDNQIRTSGPLFDYSKRLKHEGEPSEADLSKTHIVFFSQSANFINSQIMLEGICDSISKRDDIFLTIKMHPHESPANVERYKSLVGDKGVVENVQVIHRGDAVALINEADLVVQSFSNLGLDALLMETPVITFKPKTDLNARIFLYEKEIGTVVRTKSVLTKRINAFLSDPAEAEKMAKSAQKFAKEHEHFLRADNAERVLNEVLADLGRSPK